MRDKSNDFNFSPAIPTNERIGLINASDELNKKYAREDKIAHEATITMFKTLLKIPLET